MRQFGQLLRREWRLSVSGAPDFAAAMVFFLLPPFLYMLGSGAGAKLDLRSGLSMVLLTLMLALIAGMDRVLRADWACGYYRKMQLRPFGLIHAVCAKISVFVLLLCLPVTVLAPAILHLGYAPDYAVMDLYRMVPVVFLFAVNLSMIGIMVSAIGLIATQASLILFILLLPLAVPLFIFTLAAAEAVILRTDASQPLAALVAIFIVAGAICPVVTVKIIENLD